VNTSDSSELVVESLYLLGHSFSQEQHRTGQLHLKNLRMKFLL